MNMKTQLLNLKSPKKGTTGDAKIFFGDSGHGIARYDIVKHPVFLKLNTNMQGFYWRPVEIDVTQEKRSFEKGMTNQDRFVFTANLKRQILLDSVQGRAPSLVFLHTVLTHL